MGKSKLLLVDLNDKRTKGLAETITSDTSRKILNYLADKEFATEAQISKDAKIALSTVHYHMKKLMEASLVTVEEYHYSKKGREVNHYKLANQYIIIAPKKISGLKQKLKSVLPVVGMMAGVSVVAGLIQNFVSSASYKTIETFAAAPVEQVMIDSARSIAEEETASVVMASDVAIEISSGWLSIFFQSYNFIIYFLLGGLVALGLYLLYNWWVERKSN
ncbi:winged helix-turn-helix transcriptional regulator [archaeon]|jgi:DNA-binding transcriptional ArsR family regulator|nr:winged helix-turn-helix transcriptional regulator [archaeon]MBT3451506.1 winged helix-turn-helix transcriptional regulator [archaeon]MBT6869499.1 winged helix-turn-helix transcriptional regulator [archaeon]MBT7193187.1 winged helix-turn-helix transcriptional regulator [archaeon]MBT7380493.1 winged helix-turn-helix transcriptional regulator [archaeon]